MEKEPTRFLAEWRISERGWTWIVEREGVLCVYYDPEGLDECADAIADCGCINMLFNLECTGTDLGDRIIGYWRSVGSPVMNRNAPDYRPRWLPDELLPKQERPPEVLDITFADESTSEAQDEPLGEHHHEEGKDRGIPTAASGGSCLSRRAAAAVWPSPLDGRWMRFWQSPWSRDGG